MSNEPVIWTACLDCGKRVTGDSIHTCSPQLKEQDTDCQYCKQGCIRCDARKQLTDEEILELTKDSSIFEYREFDDDMVRFARAIIRKAQEK